MNGILLSMTETLKAIRFGNPILREEARILTPDEILGEEIQGLIRNMRHTLIQRQDGVGLAAPQVGESVALSVIDIRPTDLRPDLEPFSSVIINPEIIETYGYRKQKWEGCISCGTGDDTLYAKVPRYKSIKLRWFDEQAKSREEVLDGLVAHVAQHEVDHLNGILFVDRVKDTSSYMMADEYRERVVLKNKNPL